MESDTRKPVVKLHYLCLDGPLSHRRARSARRFPEWQRLSALYELCNLQYKLCNSYRVDKDSVMARAPGVAGTQRRGVWRARREGAHRAAPPGARAVRVILR